MEHTYWHKQTPTEPLFADIEWSKPEQRALAGKIAVAGGNKLGFASLAMAYSEALNTGAGQCRIILPDVLKKAIPTTILDTVFVPSNPSGGMSKDSVPQLLAAADWADMVLLIGDAGRNSETAITFEQLLQKSSVPITITRDAIDLLRANSQMVVTRPNTLLVLSFAQLQKLFQAVYYPKTLAFSMQLSNVVETLHKFTITYPCIVAVLHHDYLVVAHGGEVSTTPWDNPMAIWRGSVATRAAAYLMWNKTKPFQAVTASLLQ